MIRSYPKFEIDKNLLEKREWREFWIEDLFNVKGTVTTHPSKLIKNGTIPRVTCAATNNAIENFYQNSPTEDGKVITIDSATIGYVSYQENDFIATDHVEKLVLKDNYLNKFIGLFFISCINNAIKNKYNYGYKFSQTRIKRQKILLPIKNNKPDYDFMEKFIKEIEKLKLKRYLIFIEEELKNLKYKEIPKLDEVEWGEFWISEVFEEIKRGKRHIERNRKKGNIPYYSASKENNGLTDFISNPKFLINKNAIIYSTFGEAYFAYKNFTASDEIAILIHKKINLFNGIFISTCLNQNKIKYSFGRKAFINKINRDKILLPTKNQQPDFEYMEQFIKNMMIKKYKKYLNFIS